MWYNHPIDYLIKDGYLNGNKCLCIFTKLYTNGFIVIAMYVDHLNLVGTPHKIAIAVSYLKKEFEMKDLGRNRFCRDIKVENLPVGILIHQSAYTEKVSKRFGMEKAHSLSTPMAVLSLDIKKDSFHPPDEGQILLDPKMAIYKCNRCSNISHK